MSPSEERGNDREERLEERGKKRKEDETLRD